MTGIWILLVVRAPAVVSHRTGSRDRRRPGGERDQRPLTPRRAGRWRARPPRRSATALLRLPTAVGGANLERHVPVDRLFASRRRSGGRRHLPTWTTRRR